MIPCNGSNGYSRLEREHVHPEARGRRRERASLVIKFEKQEISQESKRCSPTSPFASV